MEYVPALAMIAGIGAKRLITILPKKLHLIASGLIILSLVPITLTLYKIHPNENVYFNSLIGGLSGAKEEKIPYWGFSFGAPYRQAISWIDKNAPENAKVVFAYELIPNISSIWVRPDIVVHNSYRSGYLRRGEYAVTLIYDGTESRSYYDSYLEKFIEPVYQAKVDDQPVVKVWKNDNEHLKVKWEEKLLPGTTLSSTEEGLVFNLNEIQKISRLEITYDQKNCTPLTSGSVFISVDGKSWGRLSGELPNDWRISALGEQPKDGNFIEPFLGQEVQYIKLILKPKDTCLRQVKDFKLYYFL